MDYKYCEEKRVIVDRIVSEAKETITEELVNEWYEYVRSKLNLHQLTHRVDLMHVMNQRYCGRVKLGLLDCKLSKLQRILKNKNKYQRPFFIEVIKKIKC